MNTLLIVGGVVLGLIFLVFVGVVVYLSQKGKNQPPSFGLVEEKYYVCSKHKLLDGGIFGKGPKLKFPVEDSELVCPRDEWEEINKKKFKKLATKWYGKDWNSEVDFWKKSN